MTMREFLEELDVEEVKEHLTVDALKFLDELKSKQSQKFTENGLKILKCMRENKEKYLNIFTSKQLGELLFMPPRSVSGSMKKLLTDGYTEKKSANPVTYGLTTLGEESQLDE